MLLGSNPSVIQAGADEPGVSAPCPLILIHDGGGTSFSYRFLGRLGRPVYGIHNPRFHSGRPWENGIPQMAGVYVELVRGLFPPSSSSKTKTRVILGGWSLGGMIALEMASLLASDPDITVEGIVMIDTVFPNPTLTQGQQNFRVVPHVPKFDTRCCPEMRFAVQRSFAQSSRMALKWTPPAPTTAKLSSSYYSDSEPRSSVASQLGAEVPELDSDSDYTNSQSPSPLMSPSLSESVSDISTVPTTALPTPYTYHRSDTKHKPGNEFPFRLSERLLGLHLQESSSSSSSLSSTSRDLDNIVFPPPMILLRASDAAPVAGDGGCIARIDINRTSSRSLGWDENYCPNTFEHVYDVPGHHYSVFEPANVGVLTEELRRACALFG